MYKTMLAGIKLVDKDEVELIARDEKNHRKHEKRKKKKVIKSFDLGFAGGD